MGEIIWLKEHIETSKHLCEISLILIKEDREDLLPTVLELLFYYAQTILEEYCIKGDK